jgi:hypothetical protein
VDVNEYMSSFVITHVCRFHEVMSSGVKGKGKQQRQQKGTSPLTHIAFNYWFHPPSQLDPHQYASPYDDMFWAREWMQRGYASAVEEHEEQELELKKKKSTGKKKKKEKESSLSSSSKRRKIEER